MTLFTYGRRTHSNIKAHHVSRVFHVALLSEHQLIHHEKINVSILRAADLQEEQE